MKNLVMDILIIWCLMLVICSCGYWYITKKQNKQIIQLESKIDSLNHSFNRYGISIGDTTLQVVTSLKINNKPYKYLHVKRIKKGKNRYYFVLTEGVAIDLIINKY